MKIHVGVALLLVLSSVVFGQRSRGGMSGPMRGGMRGGEVAVPETPTDWKMTLMKSDQPRVTSREAAPVETFAEAFEDPNVVIGVFERVSGIASLASGGMLARLPGYGEATTKFALEPLRCTKTIKGTFSEAVMFAAGTVVPKVEGKPEVPTFANPFGSQWVLVLEKTTPGNRTSRFGPDVAKYTWLNDRTMFRLFWSGYGALCLKWPKEDPKKPEPKPEYLIQVPETIVADFEAIAKAMPSVDKAKTDPNAPTAIDNVKKTLKTDLAKSIFERVLADEVLKPQNPVNASR
jgi:hypothetical protein